jgi:hypothetical protein
MVGKGRTKGVIKPAIVKIVGFLGLEQQERHGGDSFGRSGLDFAERGRS